MNVAGTIRAVSAALHTPQLESPRCHRGTKFSTVST